MRKIVPAMVALGCLSVLPHAAAQTQRQMGEWGPVMDWGCQGKHMVLVPSSKVLVWRTGDTAGV